MTANDVAQYQLATAPIGNLDAYTSLVHQIPVLSAEEEHELATRLQQQGDLDAAQRLVLSHLRFVVKIARGYSGYGLPVADLIQEGNIGLMKAVKRFDPDKGVRLVSFAVHWIRAEIHEYVIRNWRIVKIATTKAQRKLFFNLRSAKQRLGWLNQEEVESVAEDLGVTPANVMEMERRLAQPDTAFDLPNDTDDEETHFSPSAYLAAPEGSDPSMQLEQDDYADYQQQKLVNALATLDERSRDIISQRWLQENDKATLHTLADQYQVSAERIRQIESSAMKKLKQLMH
ncbi:RNA polymerase sigma factor RpoH [Methylophaga frappieri]|uniref:RNA polymerase sigma factor RpoH n=1 Tax=Methylophaga frappieri (strain ATCC BAA-2434 / DSM 25690 / JAM7) TaxID=754477 RepID=I1YFT9_METFJ|nr:RNA polymerase sigma factor RpoH [Methylophaga frappieri]AFJ01782.1 RNA polymerase sigma factor RpoH [Methylophaga frappieri]